MNKTEAFNGKYGTWTVIAGAAEGLGEAYSRALASRGMNLLMVDNQRDKMDNLAGQLTTQYGVEVKCLHLDLAKPDSASLIMEEVNKMDCRLLVYNAAFSRVKPILEADQAELDSYIAVNCSTPIRLVRAFGEGIIRKGEKGGILLMSSLAGLIGMQLVAPYAATKAFTWNLAEALHHEWKGTGVDIMACIAGATATPAYLATVPEYGWLKPPLLDPNNVVESALNNIGRKYRFIPGFKNRLSYFILTRLMPRRMAARTANRTMGKMYRRLRPGS